MEREQILKVMVPVGGFAILLLIVGAVIAITNLASRPPSTDVVAAPPATAPVDPNAPQPKFEQFPLEGPEWKDGPSGLKYWDVEIGTGETCPPSQSNPTLIPVMHYTGWLKTGMTFDSSRKSGIPLNLKFRDLIQGWQLGVPGMKVGGKRRLLIPPDLGYGARGQGSIPGNATLIFDLELIQLK